MKNCFSMTLAWPRMSARTCAEGLGWTWNRWLAAERMTITSVHT